MNLHLRVSAEPKRSCCTCLIDRKHNPNQRANIESNYNDENLLKKKNGNLILGVVKDVGCSQLALSKIWSRYKQSGRVVKVKHSKQYVMQIENTHEKKRSPCLT